MTQQYFLGVDVGGTKSCALITDERGQILGVGHAGPGNWEVVGYQQTQAILLDIIGQAVSGAGIQRAQIAGAGFGIAGYDWPEDRIGHMRVLHALGLNASMILVNDALIALAAGAAQGWGVVLIAGTGSNCRGRDRHGREARVAGAGMFYGEHGGGVEIVRQAFEMIVKAWSCRGPETALSAAFIEALGAADVEDMLAGVARGRYDVSAAYAPLVFQVAQAGDLVAQEVLRWAARELGDLAAGVIRQLQLQQEWFEVVLAGSVHGGGTFYGETLRETIQAVAPHAELVRLHVPPVIGGILLGMEAVGLDTSARRQTLMIEAETL